MTEKTLERGRVLMEKIKRKRAEREALELFVMIPSSKAVQLLCPPISDNYYLIIPADVTKECAQRDLKAIEKELNELIKEFEAL